MSSRNSNRQCCSEKFLSKINKLFNYTPNFRAQFFHGKIKDLRCNRGCYKIENLKY
ncbi:hypothetical protein [Caudoviricetes sp.]|nr:hypothetical protein [Caudoviricetes sp.]